MRKSADDNASQLLVDTYIGPVIILLFACP
jgi:hypothetical protein